MNIRSLKQKATVLDRNQMKSLTGGAICITEVNKVVAHLSIKSKRSGAKEQAEKIREMVISGELEVDHNC